MEDIKYYGSENNVRSENGFSSYLMPPASIHHSKSMTALNEQSQIPSRLGDSDSLMNAMNLSLSSSSLQELGNSNGSIDRSRANSDNTTNNICGGSSEACWPSTINTSSTGPGPPAETNVIDR